MLYYLLYHTLQHYFSPLNVFRYITVRTVYASLTAMFLALVFGPWLIRNLRELQRRPWAACSSFFPRQCRFSFGRI